MDNVERELIMLRALLKQLPLTTLQALAFEFEMEIVKRFMSFANVEDTEKSPEIPTFSVVKDEDKKED